MRRGFFGLGNSGIRGSAGRDPVHRTVEGSEHKTGSRGTVPVEDRTPLVSDRV